MLDNIRTLMVPVSPLPHSLLDLHLQCFSLFSFAQVKKALQDADLSIEDIDEVVLVGGSSRIPIVQRL
jgi:3-oxoacyl-[acyl-carrier-protein] synthase III